MLRTATGIEQWAAAATVATAVIALFLLGQGQVDRRALRRDEEMRQAQSVTMSTCISSTDEGGGVRNLIGCELIVLNESEHIVHLQAVGVVVPETWEALERAGRLRLTVNYIEVMERLLRPRGEINISLPSGSFVEAGVGGPFVILEYADSKGRLWCRRSDTYEMKRAGHQANEVQQWFQVLCTRVAPVGWIFERLPVRLAIRSAGRSSTRVPMSLRWLKATWGYWGGGEEDPWLKPEGAPALWGYSDLFPPPPKRSR